jgi:phospholipase D1/2
MAQTDLLAHVDDERVAEAAGGRLAERLFVEGETCWRCVRAHRLSFLIDAAAYFSALKAAALRARRSIIIVGWEVDSRVRLEPDRDDLPAPDQLGDFLDHLVVNRPGLHVHILAWDFPVFLAGDRELFSGYRLGLMTNRRLRYCLDSVHPVGACQHQKIVVIDDAVAFIGGIDLAARRWDTPRHEIDDPRRVDRAGRPYAPFHDMQVALDGEAAAALGALARERWRRATGKKITSVASSGDVWPEGVTVDLRDVDVAIARTDPGIDGLMLTREVEALYLASIAAAQHYVYIENQYLTAGRVAEALAESLERERGPEIVVVLPQESWDWLEQAAMADRRARLIHSLRQADRHGRLRVLCPIHADVAIHVHAKVMISDDRFVRVGSANLSNRSMGLDSECDIAIETEDHGAVRHLLTRLVGEHAGRSADEAAAAMAQNDSLLKAMDALGGSERALRPIDIGEVEELDDATGLVASSQSILDPEAPAEVETLVGRLIRAVDWRVVSRHLALVGLGMTALVALALVWRIGPLPDWLDAESLAAWWKTFGNTPIAAVITAATFVIGGFARVPLTVLITTAAIAFGPVLGSAYAFGGALLSAAVDYGVGALLGQGWARRLLGPRWRRVGDALSGRGALAIALVRMVPVAPYFAINFLAGAMRVRFIDFALGTALGLAPGILALSIFGGQIGAVLRKPNWLNIGVLVAIIVVLILALSLGVRWLHRRHGRRRRRLAAERS